MKPKCTLLRSAAALTVVAGAAAGPLVAVLNASSPRGRPDARRVSDLIVNGNFERPVLAPDSYTLYNPGQRFSGWSVVGRGAATST